MYNHKIQLALRHIQKRFHEVDHVFFGEHGQWYFCNSDFDTPDFDKASEKIDVSLLEEAAAAAGAEKGFPCAYRLLHLYDYYSLWDKFGDISVSAGTEDADVDTILEPFLHFPIGTHREEIWRWFEAQHPNFILGEVMSGIRRPDDGHEWKVFLRLRDGTTFEWKGGADGPRHAEILAIADAFAKTKNKDYVFIEVSIARYFNAN